MRILFVLPRIVTGGVERVTLRLISGLQARDHECALALRQANGELLPEAQAICPVYEVAAGGLHQFVPNLAKVIQAWQPTHIVTAFSDVGVLTYLAIKHSGLHLFWVHGVHGAHDIIITPPGLAGRLRYYFNQLCSALVYKKTDKVVAVSNGVRADILKYFKVDSRKIFTIYNPVLEESALVPRSINKKSSNPTKIVSLGRLSYEKGFDILIEAMAFVQQPWQLEIWGEGKEKKYLQNLITSKTLQENIFLRGHTTNPLAILRQADIFVLPSRYEGFGLVLVEALASGCQIVSTDCLHGPREILEDGLWGILVENENPTSLAKGLSIAIQRSNPIDERAMQERAKSFSIEKSINRWELLLKTKRD